jgi:uncharacterized membrane protein YhhN
MTTLLLIGFFLFAVLDWVAVSNGWKVGEYVAKPATLALLLLYAAAQPEASWALIAALAFSLLGDVYLMLPAEMFVAGLSAFLVGHIAYVFAIDAGLLARVGWLVGIALVSSPLAFRILSAATPDSMRPPIALYMLAISAMVASAFASGNMAAVVGALLFYGSDAMIAWNRFVAPFAAARLAIIVTYHLGQFALVQALT